MRFALPLLLIALATPVLAQDEPGFFGRLFGTDEAASDENQGGLLETFIEDNLSGEGRRVSITGFSGALSGRARLDTLTISDADGDWLTLTDVVVDWNRGALFRGRLEVTELSASEIALPRLPLPAEGGAAPTPEASGFSLPELPVSVAIDKIAAERVAIGQPVFGVETLVSVDGSLRLENGNGEANLALEKLDQPGSIVLEASYSNTTEVLALNLAVDEGEDGIIAGLLDLPGRPSVAFSVTGEAPISEYAADIRLATGGTERLTGRVTTSQPAGDESTLRIRADISGDIAPIFNTAYQPFFGDNVRVGATITTFSDGQLEVSELAVEAATLTLGGSLLIGADGLPDRIDIDGVIASEDGAVLLPLSGPETRVDRADLDISFDAAEDVRWTGSFLIAGLNREGFSAARLALDGDGRIVAGATQAVTAALEFSAEALDLGNPEAKEALGEVVTGAADIEWQSGGPLRLTALAIDGESYRLEGQADVAFAENGPSIDGRATASAERLSAFSGLAGRSLGGRIDLDTTFSAQPLAGTFDISAEGTSESLIVSQPQADRILAGSAELDLTAVRDETGIAVTLRTLETPNASLAGAARLQSGGSSVRVTGRLDEAAILLPGVPGPIILTANANEDDERIWAWQVETALQGSTVTALGTATDIYDTPIIAASGRLEARDLSDFSSLAGRTLGGSVAVDFAGEVVADLSRVSANLDGVVTDIVTGIAEADALLAGAVEIRLDGAKAGEVFSLRSSTINGEHIFLEADGTLVPDAGRFALSGRLADASRVLAGAPAEALEFQASGQQDARDWTFESRASGAGLSLAASGIALNPLGNTAAVEGEIRASAEDLSVLSELTGQQLSGRIAVEATGGVRADLSRFDVNASANGSGLGIGQAQADRLLAGDLAVTLDARRAGEAIEITTLDLTTALLDVEASGALASDGSAIDLSGRLADIAPFAEGFSGPASVTGTVGQTADGRYVLDITANGPGGTVVDLDGDVSSDFRTLALDVDGQAPLGLANSFIAPRALSGTAAFRLAVDGPPALSSVSGQVTTSGARFIAPNLNIVLNGINLNSTLSGGRAQLSLSGVFEDGGRLSVEGPLTLSAPFDTDLQIALNGVVLRDPRLYETVVDGRITISGALTGGARIAGDLALGETNIRIPSSSLGGSGEVPEIVHINEPPPVRGTRRRAGLLDADNRRGERSGPGYPLDITVNAPNRIFIRGRGLDSELGGSLRITGNTNNVVPIGAFNLIRGRLDILGQRLTLEEATATIQGSFLPVVRIRATTQAESYTIAVIVAGPVSDPEITFISEPELPQEEVLARLIFGRGLDTLSPLQAARLALAVRTLAGRGGEGVVGNIRQGAGLADLDVTTDASGNAAVRAGAYLGENVYTDVTVGAAGDTEINLNLDVSPSVTLKGSVSNSGDTSVGIFFERDY